MRAPVRNAVVWGLVVAGLGCLALAAARTIFPMTLRDFRLSGTQAGDLEPTNFLRSTTCAVCHGGYDAENSPHSTWSGSLMAQAGRDPLFYAQMALANQDVSNAGYFCLRCHVPNSFISGHALTPDGSTLEGADLDGVSCHFCHSMVDPVYKPGESPASDEWILAALGAPPRHVGNAMFVLDPDGVRRGPRADAEPLHQLLHSPFHTRGEFCGTCHDVGNVAVTRLPDGTYAYNALDTPPPSEDLQHQFPLERTYTEWKLSEFASDGVEMNGLFGGEGATRVSTCQDCHMPRAAARACIVGPDRPDVRRHDFAGAAAQVLDLIGAYTAGNPAVNPAAIAAGRAKAVDMLQRAATLDLETGQRTLRVRVTNQTGHKLPTGHIEGRRIWVNVRFLDREGGLLTEHGRYHAADAELEEASTRVYEMLVGLSESAAAATGLPAGRTGHMALADTIVKDNRIPPRGFSVKAFEGGGAPVVGATYADGQYWDIVEFPVPLGAARVDVKLFYQNTPRHYIEELRDGNRTDHWGQLLHDLWVATGRGAPILMAGAEAPLSWVCLGDVNGDGAVAFSDITSLFALWGLDDPLADFDGSGIIGLQDLAAVLEEFGRACQRP